MNALVWFRRDLRMTDNKALWHAASKASSGVIGLFVITPDQWLQHDDAPCKVRFWLDNLGSLSDELHKKNIPLRILTCPSYAEIPQELVRFAKQQECDSLFLNREYEVNERQRDEAVRIACDEAGIETHEYHDRTIVPPEEIKTKEGKFYSVFTPYRRVWNTRALDFMEQCPAPKKQSALELERSDIPDSLAGYDLATVRDDLWQAGEKAAHQKLESFCNSIAAYHDQRDIPSINGTSLLSPYLAAGVISPRQCMAAALTANAGQIEGKEGPETWISELVWRDFYTQVLVACPRVSMHRPFKLKTEAVAWRTDKADFEAWKTGKTGYPIVDAGMRQLNRTGWMHNRLRMVTAMFLSKNLLIDWRWGEQYFMQNLIDGDLAANNGGWQWSASTGTDAVPYFRIFNPFSQSKRFDPDGEFIRKFCPELEKVPPKALHDPGKLAAAIQDQSITYPEMVVDYKEGRQRALDAFKSPDESS